MRKHILCLTTAMLFLLHIPLAGQNISDIANSDPLIISGTIGTMNTYRNSSVGNGYASPMSNTVYATLNISTFGINMPFSFYYSNDNLNFNYPKISFNLTPSYKNWTGHIGLSNISMSNYVMNMSFNGVGIEYNDDKWRAGAFYGRLRNAINDDPTDPFARAPQYKRMGWGIKSGYGSGKNYIDVYLLRAYDSRHSLDQEWREIVRPQENLVLGVKGCVTPLSWFSLTANAATSILNKDSEAEKIATSTSFDKVFDTRYSSLVRFAGDVNANFMLPGFNASLSYRMIQPDYTSLGTYHISNNYHSLAVSVNTFLFKRIALSAIFSGQEDNLSGEQMYTTCGYIYALSASTRINDFFNLSASYNGYLQTQRDGTMHINDSIKIKRLMSGISLTPSFMYETDNLGHNASLSLNYSKNEDLNKYATGIGDVKTKAIGCSYNIDVKPWVTDFTITYSHQQSVGYRSEYISDVASLSASRSFLKDNSLNLSASLSLCYNEMRYTSKSLSLATDLSASYTYKKVHVFSAMAGFSKYGDVNISQTRSGLDCTDTTISLNYLYTFSLFSIKKKSKERAAL